MNRMIWGLGALVMVMSLFVAPGVAQAYIVSGSIFPGAVYGTTGGDLWYDVLLETATSSTGEGVPPGTVIYRPTEGSCVWNTTNHNWIEGDYILIIGTSGKALYSIGELDPRFGNQTVTLTGNGSGGYDLSGAGRSVTGVTNIIVVHAADVWMDYGTLTKSTGVTIRKGATAIASYTKDQLAAMDRVTYTATYNNSTTNRNGPTIASVLQAAGIDTGDIVSYVIATCTDGYKTILSMYELTHVNANEATNYALASGQDPHTLGVLDMLSLGLTGYTSESSGIRSVVTADVNNGRWGKALLELKVMVNPPMSVPPLLMLLEGD